MRLFWAKYWPILLLLAVSLLGQLYILLQPTNFLVANILPDDAFYYFKIAQNITAGNGSAFDGVNLTNGYHPLWMVVNVAVFTLVGEGGDPMLPIRLLLGVAVLANLITATLIFLVLRRLTDKSWLQSLGLAFWLFNTFVIAESLNGLETSFSLMFIALAACLATRSQPITNRNLIWLGLSSGLMMVSRLDNVFYFIVLLVWLGIKTYPVGHFKKIFLVGLLATIVVLPWVSWNYFTFGMVSTSAANTSSIVTHGLVSQDNPATWWLWPKTVLYMTNLGLGQVASQTGAPMVMMFLLGIAVYVYLSSDRSKPSVFKNISPIVFLFCGWVLMFIANASFRWVGRPWYFIALNMFLVWFLVWSFGQIKNKVTFGRTLGVVLVALVLFSFALGWKKEVLGSQAPQLAMLEAAEWGNQNLPEGTVIGVFNAGVQGYFSNHRVVNLDGLVNNAAAKAIADRELWPYIEANVDYLSDFPIYLDYRYRGFMGVNDFDKKLEIIERVGAGVFLYGDDKGIAIYKIKQP